MLFLVLTHWFLQHQKHPMKTKGFYVKETKPSTAVRTIIVSSSVSFASYENERESDQWMERVRQFIETVGFSPHPHTLTPSPSHPHPHTLTPSHTHPHPHTQSIETVGFSPHPHTLALTPSPSHPHTLTPSPSQPHPHPHPHTLTPSHPHPHTLAPSPSKQT